jgi:hypoxanthine-DNA glycosylase
MFIIHPFEAFCGHDPKILILGSFPSVKSRENNFFYGHPQNRFWKVISAVVNCPIPTDVESKKGMLDRYGIALWDSIHSCEITGSSDSSIKNVTPNDIRPILEKYDIKAIFANGKTSGMYYEKYIEPVCGVKATVLPSTSPANAAWSVQRLAEEYSVILKYL